MILNSPYTYKLGIGVNLYRFLLSIHVCCNPDNDSTGSDRIKNIDTGHIPYKFLTLIYVTNDLMAINK